ncbi:hypothetical protein [Peristeroidobacter soli]|uniref:hypothetical protein n=1 Tax=Peristeroidobacter soli TaxID=2497877 RepID=UPI00101B8093|nr:hypothetical protein [Peristeroidobacter soli]
MARPKRKWVVLSLLGAVAIVALGVVKHGDRTEPRPPDRLAAGLDHEQVEPTREIAEAAKSSSACAGQQLEIAMDDSIESVCMGALITKHNGSVRSHQIASLTAPQRWLRVEVAGGNILSAAWGSDVRPEFHCVAAACQGITISRRDAQGARVMTLERTALMRTSSNETSATQESLQLSGRIEIPAEEFSDLACPGQGVSIVTSDSSSQTFCPQGGAGFEVADDGTRRYRFTSLDGESIVVAADQDQQVRRVQYEGEVSLACRSVECGSVRISVANAEGARRFTFAGTTLIDTNSGESNAVLNGSLILPPM